MEESFELIYHTTLRSIETGDEKAKTRLAWLKLSGLGGAEIDKDGAVGLLEERIKVGDTEAMWILGLCYEFGIGTEQDIGLAEMFYNSSSFEGNVVGDYLASKDLWMRGSGVLCVRPQHKPLIERVLPIAPWTSLLLNFCSIGDKEIKRLCQFLMTNKTLTELNLGTNLFHSVGATQVSEMLMANSTLTSLNLSSNSIGDDGAATISKALIKNSTLASLVLRCNGIREKGAKELSKALMNNSTLTLLNLDWNAIGDMGCEFLSKALMTNTTLSTLSLWENNIGNEGCSTLSNSLMINSSLTLLSLFGNHIEDEGAKKMKESLMSNTTLSKLHLNENDITDKSCLNTNDRDDMSYCNLYRIECMFGDLTGF